MKENRLYIQQEQIDRLNDIGSRLRQFRQEQSLSLEEVAAKTRIQTRLLKAIEEGRIDILPEAVYIKAFIKRFADALGKDGAELARDFPIAPTMLLMRPSWLQLPAAQLRPIHLYLFYIVLVMVSVNGLSYFVRQSALPVSNARTYQQESYQPVANDNEAPTDSQELLEPSNPNNPSNPSKPSQQVRVGVTLKSQSWLRVVVDGKTEFEGVLKAGEHRTWVAKQHLTVLAGNAGGVLVTFNDEKAKELGKPGKVQKVTFEAARSSEPSPQG